MFNALLSVKKNFKKALCGKAIACNLCFFFKVSYICALYVQSSRFKRMLKMKEKGVISKKKEEGSKEIFLKGVRVNNLKNIDLRFPSGKLVVVTGLSGSGKSSIVFDTLYAEGQRRYVESLSAYARQFLGRMSKPEVDYISGISPAIAIEQKTLSKNPRSTVGTVTEIYEYLKLLYARIGQIYSPISGKEVKRHSVSNVADFICALPEDNRIYVLSPIEGEENRENTSTTYLERIKQIGFSRLYDKKSESVVYIDDVSEKNFGSLQQKYALMVDRFGIRAEDKSFYSRVFDSVQTAFNEGKGLCYLVCENKEKKRWLSFSNKLEEDGITFVKPSPNFFAFNNPYGACKRCGGTGSIVGESEELVIPNPALSVCDSVVACWRGSKMSEWKADFMSKAVPLGFPVHKPYNSLTKEQRKLLWNGENDIKGILEWFKYIDSQSYKPQYRMLSARYRGKTRCPECEGSRLRSDAAYVKVGGKNIQELVDMPIEDLAAFFNDLHFTAHQMSIAQRMLTEIRQRLSYLLHVGVPYLSLNRGADTLSGGEAQRIRLANSLGSSLVGSMYILDEPSIGLHHRDTQKLISVVKQLRDIGNSVIVVEHDEEIMMAADVIVDVGPEAGQKGGEIVFVGSPEMMIKEGQSLTAKYLRGELEIEVPASRRPWTHYISIKGARENNLKDLDVKIPLQVLTVVTGVSGSGKTTLIKKIFYPALCRAKGLAASEVGKYDEIGGSIGLIESVEMVDQDPIGRSSRSNPATYIKAFDDIRSLYASLALSRERKFSPGYFSFNTEGGRCEACQGEGKVKVEMQFMADIYLNCEECEGKRFKKEVLEIKYRGKSIVDLLEMTVDEVVEFFEEEMDNKYVKSALVKIKTLQDVGLGYLHLGQSSSSLSGGEAQRIKLAYFLRKGVSEKPTLFIFDEPTTGLHFHDINKLKNSFDALLRVGHTVLVVEHHPDIIKLADWIIDMGPEGGKDGGRILFEGVPEKILSCKDSHTAKYIEHKLKSKNGSKK